MMRARKSGGCGEDDDYKPNPRGHSDISRSVLEPSSTPCGDSYA
jgi:hypothetical protein